jgi:hypothetical protein
VSYLLPLAAAAAARGVLLLVGISAAGCEAPTAPAGAQRLTPPPVYSQWWHEVEQCSGLTGDMGRISWYVVPCEKGESGFPCDAAPDHLCGGEWEWPHAILLAGPNRVLTQGYADDEWTVKHEMLHDLTQSGEHDDLFKGCHVALR